MCTRKPIFLVHWSAKEDKKSYYNVKSDKKHLSYSEAMKSRLVFQWFSFSVTWIVDAFKYLFSVLETCVIYSEQLSIIKEEKQPTNKKEKPHSP